jgi:hypothetical protein
MQLSEGRNCRGVLVAPSCRAWRRESGSGHPSDWRRIEPTQDHSQGRLCVYVHLVILPVTGCPTSTDSLDSDLGRLRQWPRREDGPCSSRRGGVAALNRCGELPVCGPAPVAASQPWPIQRRIYAAEFVSWLRVRLPAPPVKRWPGCPASLGSMMLVVRQRFSLAPSGGRCVRTSEPAGVPTADCRPAR